MKKFYIFIIATALFISSDWRLGAQEITSEMVVLDTEQGDLHGTLTIPEGDGAVPFAVIIAGSGPTDRDGNNSMGGQNNALKFLAEGLAENGIASLRYDKRGVGKSKGAGLSEVELRFEQYAEDASAWMSNFVDDKRFSSRVFIGHSEGALLGLLAAQMTATDGYISIAGSGQSADSLIMEQLQRQPEALQSEAAQIIDLIKKGESVDKVSPLLMSLFRPSVQPYLHSWFKYCPKVALKQVSVPILIVHGVNDLQVKYPEAEKLMSARPDAQLLLLENMNHVLKDAPATLQENMATYSQADLPLAEGLVTGISSFILSDLP